MTDGGIDTLEPAIAVWLSPAFVTIDAGAPATPLAVNTAAGRVPTVAERAFAPAVVPSVHEPAVAIPAVLVVAEVPEIVPPPAVTVNTTVAPETAFPFTSFTTTEGATDTPEPATAL
jgi:hypothetical protein